MAEAPGWVPKVVIAREIKSRGKLRCMVPTIVKRMISIRAETTPLMEDEADRIHRELYGDSGGCDWSDG